MSRNKGLLNLEPLLPKSEYPIKIWQSSFFQWEEKTWSKNVIVSLSFCWQVFHYDKPLVQIKCFTAQYPRYFVFFGAIGKSKLYFLWENMLKIFFPIHVYSYFHHFHKNWFHIKVIQLLCVGRGSSSKLQFILILQPKLGD